MDQTQEDSGSGGGSRGPSPLLYFKGLWSLVCLFSYLSARIGQTWLMGGISKLLDG